MCCSPKCRSPWVLCGCIKFVNHVKDIGISQPIKFVVVFTVGAMTFLAHQTAGSMATYFELVLTP